MGQTILLNQESIMTGNVRVYGAGGAGVNVAANFTKRAEQPGYATLHPAFIDTSRSNLKAGIDDKDVYILENVDGAGKIRREHANEIQNVIKNVLLKMKPMDFNIVVFSASGGSGSVFGPLLMGELLERGLPAVAVVVGSDESTLTCQNTMNTLKSLEGVSRSKGKPLVMYYDHNKRGVRRSEIDESLCSAISALSALASRQNDEMDSQDIVNWLEYHKSSAVRPQLSLLSIYQSHEKVESVQNPISIASLYRSADDETINVVPDYNTHGFTGPDVDIGPLHFIISVDGVPAIGQRIQKTLDELQEIRDSRVEHTSLLSEDDSVSAGGLVL